MAKKKIIESVETVEVEAPIEETKYIDDDYICVYFKHNVTYHGEKFVPNKKYTLHKDQYNKVKKYTTEFVPTSDCGCL